MKTDIEKQAESQSLPDIYRREYLNQFFDLLVRPQAVRVVKQVAKSIADGTDK